MDLIQSTLISKINRLEQENKEYREALQRFTIWPKPYIEVSKSGLYPALAHAEFVLNKHNSENATQCQQQ